MQVKNIGSMEFGGLLGVPVYTVPVISTPGIHVLSLCNYPAIIWNFCIVTIWILYSFLYRMHFKRLAYYVSLAVEHTSQDIE